MRQRYDHSEYSDRGVRVKRVRGLDPRRAARPTGRSKLLGWSVPQRNGLDGSSKSVSAVSPEGSLCPSEPALGGGVPRNLAIFGPTPEQASPPSVPRWIPRFCAGCSRPDDRYQPRRAETLSWSRFSQKPAKTRHRSGKTDVGIRVERMKRSHRLRFAFLLYALLLFVGGGRSPVLAITRVECSCCEHGGLAACCAIQTGDCGSCISSSPLTVQPELRGAVQAPPVLLPETLQPTPAPVVPQPLVMPMREAPLWVCLDEPPWSPRAPPIVAAIESY